MANIKHYYPCGGCGATWAMANMVVVGATQYCPKCAPEARVAFDEMMGKPLLHLSRLGVSGVR